MSAVIEVEGLVKRFGATTALDGLDLRVGPGEVAAFLGPNGAGKSTTLRVLLGLLRPDAGHVRLLGGDPWADAVGLHRRLAYVPGDVTLWPTLTGGEAVDVLLRLRGADPRRTRRDELVERFALDTAKRCRSYSKGNRQKVALVAALAADVDLYLLDEPTSGLDPLMEEVFTQCVVELRDAGRTVLLSSHLLAEVEKLCDTVTIVRAGRTVQAGRIDALRHLLRSRVTARVERDPAGLASVPGVHDLDLGPAPGGRIGFTVEPERTGEVMVALTELGLRDLTVVPASVEELFLREYAADGGTGR